jgi:dihydroorotate dehydrogenase (fumarate)
MIELRTRYLGLDLRSPLVASSSPLTGSLDGLLRLQSAGAAAVVLPSLFEEELAGGTAEAETGVDDGAARAAGYGSGLTAYLSLLRHAKAELSIPVIASLNGVTRGGWVRHATRLEAAGADALELNVYYVSTSPDLSATDVELRYLDLVGAVRIPLAVKLSPYYSAMANRARRLVESGADGLVLFNRFYQPDLDVERLDVVPGLDLSSPAELRLPLRWIAILHGHLGSASLAASSGVHAAEDVVKALLAGADVAMTTSALLRHGPEHLGTLEAGLRDWLGAHGHAAPAEVRGRLSQRAVRDPLAYERANYLRTLASYAAGTRNR